MRQSKSWGPPASSLPFQPTPLFFRTWDVFPWPATSFPKGEPRFCLPQQEPRSLRRAFSAAFVCYCILRVVLLPAFPSLRYHSSPNCPAIPLRSLRRRDGAPARKSHQEFHKPLVNLEGHSYLRRVSFLRRTVLASSYTKRDSGS